MDNTKSLLLGDSTPPMMARRVRHNTQAAVAAGFKLLSKKLHTYSRQAFAAKNNTAEFDGDELTAHITVPTKTLFTEPCRKAEGRTAELSGRTLTLYFPAADKAPDVRINAEAAMIGRQRVTLKDGNLVFQRSGESCLVLSSNRMYGQDNAPTALGIQYAKGKEPEE